MNRSCAATTRSKSGIPESFNVLVKEMRSLGLNVDLHNSKQQRGDGDVRGGGVTRSEGSAFAERHGPAQGRA